MRFQPTAFEEARSKEDGLTPKQRRRIGERLLKKTFGQLDRKFAPASNYQTLLRARMVCDEYGLDEPVWVRWMIMLHEAAQIVQMNQIYTGDARELADSVPDECADLVFADPIYDRMADYAWVAEFAARVLKPDHACLVWQQVGLIPETCAAMSTHLTYRWMLVHYKPNRVKEKFGAAGFSKWEPLIWFDKGKTPRRRWLDVFQTNAFASSGSNHQWSKAIEGIVAVIEHFTKPGDLVIDPFCGGGVVPAACKLLERNYIGVEIDPEIAERARERVASTQPPLPMMAVQQTTLMGLATERSPGQ